MESISLQSSVSGPAGAQPILILHGLLGRGRNWASVVKLLEARYRCHALDLRNHGASPHADSMAYADQAADVAAYMDAHKLAQAAVVGHSMGGKVAMTLAVQEPARVSHLLVLDMAPKPYPPRWEAEFAAMRALPVAAMRSRHEIDAALEPSVRDWAFRKFLLTNLVRRPEGGFAWAVNLPLLESCLPDLFQHPLKATDTFDGPTLFIRGERSRFVLDEDLAAILRHFPQGRLETVAGAGHNVHFDQPGAFVSALEAFLA